MKKIKDETVKVTFYSDHIMLFGNSYKTWEEQLQEYCSIFKLNPQKIEKSAQKWCGLGMKWCAIENFNRELADRGDSRTLDDFTF